jgi:glycosyltransferase involved in cell wall biosynthesis|tara:strand:+ start:1404 stop:2072 length:669 start_codon:yes stop_codon:yes gene_type:complete
MTDLTLIIPAKNESESLPVVLQELKNIDVKVKILLHKNDTLTIDSIKNFNCEIIYQLNHGYGDALIHGINLTSTKYFCIFNADGSFNPLELKNMLDKMNRFNYDFVFASRYQKNSGSDDDTIITLVGNFIFTKMGNIFFNLPITDILYTFVLGKTDSAKRLNLNQKDFGFCIELPIKAIRHGMSMFSTSSHERKRIAGIKKVNALKDGFLILKHMIYLFFKR